MILEEFYMISQVVAAFAVMGSLIFVGLQMRQSDKTQRAMMHQERTHRNISVLNTFLEPQNRATMNRSRDIEQARALSSEDRAHLSALLRITLLATEETFWQHRQNLLEDNVLEDQRQVYIRILFNPAFKAIWEQSREIYPDDFRAFIDDIAASSNIREDQTQDDAGWVALLNSTVAKQGQ